MIFKDNGNVELTSEEYQRYKDWLDFVERGGRGFEFTPNWQSNLHRCPYCNELHSPAQKCRFSLQTTWCNDGESQ